MKISKISLCSSSIFRNLCSNSWECGSSFNSITSRVSDGFSFGRPDREVRTRLSPSLCLCSSMVKLFSHRQRDKGKNTSFCNFPLPGQRLKNGREKRMKWKLSHLLQETSPLGWLFFWSSSQELAVTVSFQFPCMSLLSNPL